MRIQTAYFLYLLGLYSTIGVSIMDVERGIESTNITQVDDNMPPPLLRRLANPPIIYKYNRKQQFYIERLPTHLLTHMINRGIHGNRIIQGHIRTVPMTGTWIQPPFPNGGSPIIYP
eukprot:GHVR01181740.1.p1 GENE.GHVR01181740.1~~GHVR01181740.1.p1  ORF type:complete len:130 (+),score=11.80 GHVR01181740.1:42-392(+)